MARRRAAHRPDRADHRVIQAQLGDVSTGDGAAWLPQTTTVLRVEEHIRQTRTVQTGRLGGFQHDLAAGALWALHDAGRTHTTLERFDL